MMSRKILKKVPAKIKKYTTLQCRIYSKLFFIGKFFFTYLQIHKTKR